MYFLFHIIVSFTLPFASIWYRYQHEKFTELSLSDLNLARAWLTNWTERTLLELKRNPFSALALGGIHIPADIYLCWLLPLGIKTVAVWETLSRTAEISLISNRYHIFQDMKLSTLAILSLNFFPAISAASVLTKRQTKAESECNLVGKSSPLSSW